MSDDSAKRNVETFSFGRIHPRPEPPDPDDLPPVDTAPYEKAKLAELERYVLSLALAEVDIRNAWVFSGMLLSRPTARALLDSEREAFVAAIVAAYTRPFAKGPSRLPSAWPGYTRPDWNDRHSELMLERNKHIGHSDPRGRAVTIEVGHAGEIRWKMNLPWTTAKPFQLERTHEMCLDLLSRLRHTFVALAPILLSRSGMQTLVLPTE